MFDIFEDTTHAPESPITSANNALAKCAGRLVLSMIYSLQYLTGSVADNFLALVNYDNLWALALVLAGWVIATIIGGAIGLAVNGILLVYGLYSLYEQLAMTWDSLKLWGKTAYNATNDDQLHEAGRHFAEALSLGALTIIEIVVTHRVFTRIEGSLRKRFPTPEWLKTEFERGKRLAKANEETTTKTKLRELAESAGDAARGTGLTQVPVAFPTGVVVLAAVTVASVATAAVAISVNDTRRHG